jgi:hypothetical protein
MNNKTIAIIPAIILVATIAAIPSFKAALADESPQKVAEKHQRVEDKHGFASHQDIKFHEKHGFPNLPILGDLSCKPGKKDSLASTGC